MKKLSLWLAMYKQNAYNYFDNLSLKAKNAMKNTVLPQLAPIANYDLSSMSIEGVEDLDNIKVVKGKTHYFHYDILPAHFNRDRLHIVEINGEHPNEVEGINIKLELERIVVDCHGEGEWEVEFYDGGEGSATCIFNSEGEEGL